jgi:hypothetical protein
MYKTFLTLREGFLGSKGTFSRPQGTGGGPVMARARRIVGVPALPLRRPHSRLRRMSIGTEGLVLGRRARDTRPRGR